MEVEEPRFVPGDVVVFEVDSDEAMGQILGATHDKSEDVWQYFITNPISGQQPYFIDTDKIKYVRQSSGWVPADA